MQYVPRCLENCCFRQYEHSAAAAVLLLGPPVQPPGTPTRQHHAEPFVAAQQTCKDVYRVTVVLWGTTSFQNTS